ncbi:valine--tRNA ligase [Pseudonocardia sp.]|uniref:valine--tRNA ligase n=1 Tax=Pseudonocardia sp. TaxID=60912 RepID=UPI0031FD635A
MTDTLPPRTADLPAQWNPGEVEAGMYQRWVEAGYFTADASSDRPAFSNVIPPPNVTGSLHIGHAFEHTLIDILVRRRRMQGYETLWLPGMDHASIAVHALVERALAAEGTSRREMGREAFVERTWQWKAEHGGAILAQMRRLGDSVDWSRERFTMDEGLSRAVVTIFKRLYDDGLIYRAERMVNWSPELRSVLSDVEVEHREVEGELVSIKYGSDDAGTSLVVATTRVETMLGDTAVAVHPDDERYKHLVGREIELPLVGRMIPVVADDHVDPSFGTGAVKVTPAHDPNDFEIGRRHELPSLTILDERGVVTAPGPFQGLDRFEARPAVVAALLEQGRIVAEKRPYVHSVGHCSRCRTTVEPRLSLQWFVRVESLAKAAGDAVREGKVAIHPPSLEGRYFAWVDDMHDWCISRQLWWGHRIPVWYGPSGETVCVGPDEQPPAGEGWVQDNDVLDTWFSSGLWPFSTLGWPDETADLRRFYPTSVLVTGYDILFFWVARMMLFGLYAMDGRQPFDVVALHGMVRDKHGKKMSKSFGNAVDPLDWMDAYGSDALRFTLARGANPGTDVPIGEEWVQGSRNFCNKLWNAARFALINGATTAEPLPPAEELSAVDRWLLSRLSALVADVDADYEQFEFAKAAESLYHFVWDDFCDWYVELAKVPLAAGGESARRTRLVLGHALDTVLRLLHPVVPFVTEALWTSLTHGESVVIASWPETDPTRLDPAAEAEFAALRDVVTEVRRFRSEQGLRPSQRVGARLAGLDAAGIAAQEPLVRSLTRLEAPAEEFAPTASLSVRGVRVELDLSGAIDVGAERARLRKDLAAAEKELQAATAKLANTAFIAKAPEPVVAKVRGRLTAAEADMERISGQLDALPAS